MTLTETIATITLCGSLGSSMITGYVALRATAKSESNARTIAENQILHDSNQRALDRGNSLKMIRAQALEDRLERAYIPLQVFVDQVQTFANGVILSGSPDVRELTPPSLEINDDPLLTLTMTTEVRTMFRAVINIMFAVKADYDTASYWWDARKQGLPEATDSYRTTRDQARARAKELGDCCYKLSEQMRQDLQTHSTS